MIDLGIVPIYQFNNSDSCCQLITVIKNNTALYNHLRLRQMKWLENNTMELQLEHILLKKGIL